MEILQISALAVINFIKTEINIQLRHNFLIRLFPDLKTIAILHIQFDFVK